ncbi:hypothetical protein ACFZAM_31670 [Streptomyces sp. NPDC008079]|uniref:hypothetical protein n=1 Tax=Streptomyces sp. NPDC008079 TaxID=3364806 RepID=UPI0036E781D7
MATSPSRAERRKHLQRQAGEIENTEKPEEIEEIDFEAVPGPLISGLGGPVRPWVPKSLVVPGTLDAHIKGFVGRNPRTSFKDTTIALWRILLRDAHTAEQAALAEHRRTGLPVHPRYGHVYTLLDQELDTMAAEAADKD